jgi:hypothetical protein
MLLMPDDTHLGSSTLLPVPVGPPLTVSAICDGRLPSREEFLKGKTYSINISSPGEEPSGEEGVLASGGCPFCGLKGHKTQEEEFRPMLVFDKANNEQVLLVGQPGGRVVFLFLAKVSFVQI